MTIPKHLIPYVSPLRPEPTGLNRLDNVRRPLKGLLFDVYGTLFISASGDIGLAQKKAGRLVAISKLLRKYAIPISSEALLKQLFRLINEAHAAMKKEGIPYPEVEIDEVWKVILKNDDPEVIRTFALEYEMITNPVYPMPHLRELIDSGRDRGMRLGLISNAQFYTPLLFEWFLGKPITELGFDSRLIFLSYCYRQAKPSLYLYEKACEQLEREGIAPQEVLYVGNDMLNDIYPAARTGFQTALFAGDKRSLRLREDDACCREVQPDMVITDLNQLIPGPKG